MASAERRMKTMVQRMRDHDYRITPQRLAILEILAVSDGHPTVEQIYDRIKVNFPTTSLATVYKNISIIKELGEVLELGFSDGSNRYDGNKPYPHPHLICVKCKKITDPDLATLKEMAEEVADETGFKILTHRLDFFGVCGDCHKKT
jgi:Fur family peroxide stress response transcriptional regulator